MALYIGVMSGTSLDGLDIALIEQTSAIKLIATHYIPMPESLRAELLGLCASGPDEIARSAIAQQHWVKLAAQGIHTLLDQQQLKPDGARQCLGKRQLLAVGVDWRMVRTDRRHPVGGGSSQRPAVAV